MEMINREIPKLKIAFLAPHKAKKACIVGEYFLNKEYIDIKNSLVITDSINFPSWVPNNFRIVSVTDKTLYELSASAYLAKFDYLISCGWSTKVCNQALSSPTVASINCHSSYLPDFKGSSVYNHYWANCEEYAGATVHIMTDQFDKGNILTQQKFKLTPKDTPHSILARASELTGPLLSEAVILVYNGYSGAPHSGGRYFYKLSYWRLLIHRFYNRIAVILGLTRYLTPHKQ